MNEIELKSFPFNSILDDREYEAEVFRNYFGKFLTTGVYFGLYNNYGDYSMKVVSGTGLNVKVTKGCGIIKGADFELKEDTVLNIEMPIGAIRNDMVVVRFDDTLEERKTILYVKQGTDTAFAELERTTDVYEIGLAKIVVGDRVLEVTTDDITDTRRDKELCGIVTSLIDIDIQDVLDDITAKKDAFFKDLTDIEKNEMELIIQDLQNYCNLQKGSADVLIQDLQEYCNELKQVLDDDVAVNLFNKIYANTQNINQVQADVTQIETNITNLQNDKANKKKIYNITIDTRWTGDTAPYMKEIDVEEIEETDEVNIYPVWSEELETRLQEREEYNKISMAHSLENKIKLTCDEEKPTMSLNARLEVLY